MVIENGIWITNDINDSNHVIDISLANTIVILLKKWKVNDIVDIGCGNGKYGNILSNYVKYYGFDGNPHINTITNNICKMADFSKANAIDIKCDCVLSLEVGEHIDKKYEDIFIDNIYNTSKKYIIISWALENQGGQGHINERNNEYIESLFLNKGCIRLIEDEKILRNSATEWYFKKSIMIFKKYDYTENILSSLQGSIVVVGNGIINDKVGSIINTFNNVIRLNNYVINGYEESVGSKVTLWVTHGNKDIKNKTEFSFAVSPFTIDSIESNTVGNLNMIYSNLHPKSLINIERLTLGGALLSLFDSLKINITIYGFDFLKSGHYFDINHKQDIITHKEINKEEKFIRTSKYIEIR